MNIFCSQETVSQVDSVKYLGIFIDSKLTWTSQLENLGKKVAGGVGALFKLQPVADVHLLRIVYFSLVLPSKLRYFELGYSQLVTFC